ncbi:MAG TPA: SigE family RNA polymerase sigma factor [Pseudolysinimonas sp.]|nr:SigE family RNA polymerase sigma factor [Pseudolysinimonas sp.]
MARESGWERVVTELVAERGDALLRYAALLCGDRDDAADLVQEALVKTFGRLRNGFGVESAEAYVRRVILNTHLDGGRRRTRWRRVAPLEYVPEQRESDAPAVDAKLDLHGELRKLTPRERACLVLRYYDDLTVAAIAETLGISAGTVKRYLSDGLAKMAIALADDGTAADRLGPAGAAPRARTPEGDRDAHRI